MRHKAAPTRRQLRRRRLNRRQRAVSLLLLAGLAAGAAVPCVMFQPWTAAAPTPTRFDRSTALTRTDLVEASRSVEREAGVWTLGESDEPTGSLTVRAANNPVVKALINGRDADALPDGFNPDHATGDSGDDYPYGQCTWWAYERRKQLGLPVGGRFGNGGQWADSARALGFWVDRTPRAGDVAVFAPGVFGWRALYTAGGNSNWSGYLCRKDEQCVADRYYTFDGTASILPFTQIGLWDDYGTAYVSAMQLTQVDPITHRSLARDGYTFTGWSKDVSHVTGDMTVQARYEPARYTVDYDANGGTGSMPASTLTYDSPQALSAIGFTKAGYSFTGWNTRKDGSGKTFTDKQTVSNLLTHEGASGTLYAQWTPTPPIVTVIFHVNNGGSDETVKRVWASNNLEMKTIDLPSGWSNSGFAFRGWNLKADGTGVEYEAGETLYGRLTAETTDLYADWNGLQTQLPNTGGILRHGLIGTLIAGMGLVVWTMGRRRARRR